jgi:RHS repeat-associated protein
VYTYTYDLAGNRTSVQLNSGTPAVTTYNVANQITNAGFTYDNAGNLLNDGTAAYTYDALSRTTARGTTSYAYNGDGTLVSQTASSVTTRYTQDLAAPLSQVLQTQVGAAARTEYLYGLTRLASLNSGVKTWYAADALGSVRRTVTDAGVPLGIVNYDPWGTVETGTVPTFGFTGELQDVGAGLVNLRARWYSTGRGRFTTFRWRTSESSDTLPYSHHPYAYALGNPVNNIDPTGRCVPGVERDCLPIWELDQGLNFADGRRYIEAVLVEPLVGIVTPIQVLIDDPGTILRGAKYLKNNPADSAFVIGQAAIAPFTDICQGITNGDPNQVGRGLSGVALLLAGARFARTPRATPILRGTGPELQAARQSFIALTRTRILQVAGFSERGIPLIIDESTVINVPGIAKALRARGYNARTIQEIYKDFGIKDNVIYDLAEAIDARVVTYDRGRNLGGGFQQRAIQVDGRVHGADTVIRVIEEAIGEP